MDEIHISTGKKPVCQQQGCKGDTQATSCLSLLGWVSHIHSTKCGFVLKSVAWLSWFGVLVEGFGHP